MEKRLGLRLQTVGDEKKTRLVGFFRHKAGFLPELPKIPPDLSHFVNIRPLKYRKSPILSGFTGNSGGREQFRDIT